MRLILTTIILTMLAQPVWAASVQQLYQWCKPMVDRGFKDATSIDVVGALFDGLCTGYMLATIEQANQLCRDISVVEENYSDRPDIVIGFKTAARLRGTSATLKNLDAVTQTFVNFAAANPDKWEYRPNSKLWLNEKYPCKE